MLLSFLAPALLAADGNAAAPAVVAAPLTVAGATRLSPADNDLLDDLSRRSFRYFWEQTSPQTGLVLDRALASGKTKIYDNQVPVASIAATGFGLTGVCIADSHGWISHRAAKNRAKAALRFLANKAPQEHGWFYHYMDANTGERVWKSEVSSIDTALLLAGVLTARECFAKDAEIVKLANRIYNRVDFPWMMNGSPTNFSHGWTPEKQFLPYRWDSYSELLILYALGIGSPTHAIPAETWDTWQRPIVEAGEYTYVGRGPLFIHQYSQAWLDLRNRDPREHQPNYYMNSIAATRAHRALFSKYSPEYHGYTNDIWGVTASDSAAGYTDWGGAVEQPQVDGTVVPSAAAGSLMFAPDICLPAVRAMLDLYGSSIYGRYGFVDAFDPNKEWASAYVIGIDQGITLLSAENLRTGRVWKWFMENDAARRALDSVGLKVLTH
jgi:hypothetical protein